MAPCAGVPVYNQAGKIERWFGTSTDIDDFKRASSELEALNESLEQRVQERSLQLAEGERRHSQLVESVRDYAIFMLDSEGRIASWNIGAERIKGYEAYEILGRHFSVFYSGEEIARGHPQHELRLAMERGEYREEGWRLRKDGSAFWASVLITAIRGEDGEVSAFSKVVRDMTERKRAEELLISAQKRAEEANRAKSSFLASMSHEIRTPMNAILGMADLLWETGLDPVQREYVGRFRRAGANLLTLINDILDFSKIESGHFELESIEFDLLDLLDRTAELMESRARVKGIALATRVSPVTPVALIGDPGRLQQILVNLIGNAVKFTENGSIVLTVAPHADETSGHIQFSVRDTGIGIPEEKLGAIFEDFTQAESSTTRRFGGTGLGLGISRRLVERMGGRLIVSSVVAEGSVFSFDAAFARGGLESGANARTVRSLAGSKVLFVDDNPTNRLIQVEMCIGWGMLPVEASSASQARRLMAGAAQDGNPFSLVLLDHVMPDAKGFDALDGIRRADPGIRVIVTSSDSQPGDVTKAKALGAAGYLTKPIRRTDLLGAISSALRPEKDVEPASADAASRLSESSRSGARPMTILIAEDSEDNRFVTAAYLKSKPYELTFVFNGREALEMFSQREFDLVLMDVQMPVMDGLSATESIRALEREKSLSPTPVIALTANALVEDNERSRLAGCDAHLTKPISKDRLIAAIESFRSASLKRNPGAARATGEELSKVIAVPEGLEELSRSYISSRRAEIGHLRELLTREDLESLRTIGHNMKGTGASYGFPGLTDLGNAMEHAARSADLLGLARHLTDLEAYVEYASDSICSTLQLVRENG